MGGEQKSNATLSVTPGLAGAEWMSWQRMRFVNGSAVVLQNCGLDCMFGAYLGTYVGTEGQRDRGTEGQMGCEHMQRYRGHFSVQDRLREPT